MRAVASRWLWLIWLAALYLAPVAYGEEVYLAPELFLSESFDGDVPDPEVIWVTKSLKGDVADIRGHSGGPRRIRYWASGRRSAWILEEIGKVEPITTGIVVDNDAIVRVAVLIYRESRGWEVRHPFFTDQFIGARLVEDRRLDRRVDGISGATLSVDALTRLARLALYLDSRASEQR